MQKHSRWRLGVLALAVAVQFLAPGLLAALTPLFVFVGDTTVTTDIDEAMKIIFSEPIVNNVVTDSELLDIFEDGDGIQEEKTTGGRYIETAQLFGLPAGVGARSENDYIPVPKGPEVVNGRITLKKVMGAIEMSAETMKRVKNDEGAFLNYLDRALPFLVQRVTNESDRMTLGYGSAIKARVNAASPATNLVVDSAFGVAGFNRALLQFLKGETLIASPNADGSSPRSTPSVMTVNHVDHRNGYLIVDQLAGSLADDDYLFAGDAAANSAGKEWMGLLGMVDDGGVLNLFQNIDRSSYPEWTSFVVDVITTYGAGQKLTEEVLAAADDEAYTTGGAKVDTLVTSRAGLRQLWQDGKGDRQINDPRSYTLGKGPIRMLLTDRVVEVRVARKVPDTVLYGLTRSTFKKWMLHGWEWDDTVGSLWRQVTDATGRKDAFYTYGSMYNEIGCMDPQQNFRIENWATS